MQSSESRGYDVERVRAEFPALTDGTSFLDGPGGTQVPLPVAQAVAHTLTLPISNRGPLTASARLAEQVVADFRSACADLLGASPGGIVHGRSATALAFDTARTLSRTWSAGDEIVATRLDHDSNIRPWLMAAETVGATVRFADFDPLTGELPTDAVTDLIGPRTKLVAFTAASNLLGTRPDIAALAAAARSVGALSYLDAVHHVPHVRTSFAELGVDFLACSPYKFLGPHCGVLAAHPDLLESLRPAKLVPSTDAVPERFELGTLPYELLAGTTAAVDFIAELAPGSATDRAARLDASFSALHAHEGALRAELEAGLDELAARRYGRAERRTPTVLFSLPGHSNGDVAAHLASRGVNAPAGSFYALLASEHLGLGEAGAVRAGIAPYSTSADVHRLLSALAELPTR